MIKINGHAITKKDLDDIAIYMDNDIREELHRELAPCSPDEFLRAYLQRDPDFRDVLEGTFQWENDADEDGQTPEEFAAELFDDIPTEAAHTLYNEDAAKADLEHIRKERDNVPSGLTAAALVDIWNRLACESSPVVVTPEGQSVPRHTRMDNRQIAKAIDEADDWGMVADLVDYIDEEYLHLEKDEDGYFIGDWERAIEDWCDQQ